MTRTYGKQDKGYRAEKRENACKQVKGYNYVVFGHNFNKNAYYEMCYNECTEWELQMSQKDVENMDSRAMDKEWKRMQDTVEQETE